jgi:hypothetical protein
VGPGYTFNVRVAGTLAHLLRQDGLHIIETRDPAHRRARALPAQRPRLLERRQVDAGDQRFALIADSPIDIVDVPRGPPRAIIGSPAIPAIPRDQWSADAGGRPQNSRSVTLASFCCALNW